MADKNLDGNGLSEVWVRAAQLVKKYTGAVDSTKGDLQTQVNEKLSGTDDTKDNIVSFTSGDTANPTAWKDVATLDSKEKHSSLLNKISTMFSNIRYLYKNVGGIKGLSSSSAITTQGEYALDAREKNASVEGTLANQISNLNSNLSNKNNIVNVAVNTDLTNFADNLLVTGLTVIRTGSMENCVLPHPYYAYSNGFILKRTNETETTIQIIVFPRASTSNLPIIIKIKYMGNTWSDWKAISLSDYTF